MGGVDVMDLVDWLRAQLDEDERVAVAAPSGPWVWQRRASDDDDEELVSHTARWWPPSYGQPIPAEGYPTTVLGAAAQGANPYLNIEDGAAEHIAAWDPARVLAEVKAKRAVLEAHDQRRHHCPLPIIKGALGQLWDLDDTEPAPACWTVLLLAQPYAERPGWQPEWSVS